MGQKKKGLRARMREREAERLKRRELYDQARVLFPEDRTLQALWVSVRLKDPEHIATAHGKVLDQLYGRPNYPAVDEAHARRPLTLDLVDDWQFEQAVAKIAAEDISVVQGSNSGDVPFAEPSPHGSTVSGLTLLPSPEAGAKRVEASDPAGVANQGVEQVTPTDAPHEGKAALSEGEVHAPATLDAAQPSVGREDRRRQRQELVFERDFLILLAAEKFPDEPFRQSRWACRQWVRRYPTPPRFISPGLFWHLSGKLYRMRFKGPVDQPPAMVRSETTEAPTQERKEVNIEPELLGVDVVPEAGQPASLLETGVQAPVPETERRRQEYLRQHRELLGDKDVLLILAADMFPGDALKQSRWACKQWEAMRYRYRSSMRSPFRQGWSELYRVRFGSAAGDPPSAQKIEGGTGQQVAQLRVPESMELEGSDSYSGTAPTGSTQEEAPDAASRVEEPRKQAGDPLDSGPAPTISTHDVGEDNVPVLAVPRTGKKTPQKRREQALAEERDALLRQAHELYPDDPVAGSDWAYREWRKRYPKPPRLVRWRVFDRITQPLRDAQKTIVPAKKTEPGTPKKDVQSPIAATRPVKIELTLPEPEGLGPGVDGSSWSYPAQETDSGPAEETQEELDFGQLCDELTDNRCEELDALLDDWSRKASRLFPGDNTQQGRWIDEQIEQLEFKHSTDEPSVGVPHVGQSATTDEAPARLTGVNTNPEIDAVRPADFVPGRTGDKSDNDAASKPEQTGAGSQAGVEAVEPVSAVVPAGTEGVEIRIPKVISRGAAPTRPSGKQVRLIVEPGGRTETSPRLPLAYMIQPGVVFSAIAPEATVHAFPGSTVHARGSTVIKYPGSTVIGGLGTIIETEMEPEEL